MKSRPGSRCSLVALAACFVALLPLGCAATAKGFGQAAAKVAVGAAVAAAAAGVNHAVNGPPAEPGDHVANDSARERKIREQKEREEADAKLRERKQTDQTADDFPPP